MYFLPLLLAVFSGTIAFSVDVAPHCELPLDMGKTPCKDGKKEIRYHFDTRAFMPLAFELNTLDAAGIKITSRNHVLLETEFSVDFTGCAAGSDPLPKTELCQEDKECGPKGKCEWFGTFKRCCDKEITEKFGADFSPKCAKGKKVVAEGE
ncbi:hypothetical protein GCK72_018519 [Caenorhabditis remanei]|uniref:Uncharacterized protein n=1 Tax=Caenorhabditis remanei TaxID=31234 RepID=A0A6A5GBH6_CAERE|nr:hypothetical protein GCK72_018519 [Caenorhabditis remanei]KAF1751965.1 hypothetical protein GCK72_018519 [Caenorhabditis remanei]